MAAEGCRKRLHDEGTCSVCLDYFTDPVTLNCGHNFCRNCIINSWKESPTTTTCPQCREIIEVKRLRPNRQLANMVEVAKDLSDLLKHRTVPLEEADQECKVDGYVFEDVLDQICLSLKTLRKERKNILAYQAESEEESQDLLAQIEAEREKTAAAFRQLRQFLEDQEKLLLSQTEEVGKEIAKRRDEHHASLSGELSCLDSLILEMEEKQQQQSSNELQNLGDILERCKKEPFKNPGAFPAVLKWGIYDFSDRNIFLDATVKKFKDNLLSGLQIQEVKVTLDPKTAHPELIVLPDLKSVRKADERQDVPNNSERFNHWHAVLGHEEFKNGRFFWDVAVGRDDVRSEGWAVGVATEYVWKKTNSEISPDRGVWDLGKWDGEYRVRDPEHNLPLFVRQEVKNIRVTVNCAGKQVAFFDADTGEKLFVYKVATFVGETLLPIFFVSGGGQLTLLS